MSTPEGPELHPDLSGTHEGHELHLDLSGKKKAVLTLYVSTPERPELHFDFPGQGAFAD
jgi:hypothetical protein